MLYLKISSPGITDHRCLTVLGVTTSRGDNKKIGEFGSGVKNSLALLLRKGTKPVIFSGNLKMEFFSVPEEIQGEMFNRVKVRYSGPKNLTEDLGFTTEWGAIDWDKEQLAFREFVSNAIDSCVDQGFDQSAVRFEVTDKVRAKAGHTQVYLEYTNEIQNAYGNLHKIFLHFGRWNPTETVFPNKDEFGKIYKKGVLVCQLKQRSFYNYNLGNDLKLDESRNAESWATQHYSALAITRLNAEKLAPLLTEIIKGTKIWESELEPAKSYNEDDYKVWIQTFKSLYGPKAVLVNNPLFLDYVKNKGYIPICIDNTNWYCFMKEIGLPVGENLLSSIEKEGNKTCLPTPQIIEMVDKVWSLLELMQMTNGKSKPKVEGFIKVMEGGAQLWGYYEMGGNTIFIENSLNEGKQLFKVVLEELGHFISQATDASRDFQDWAFRVATEFASRLDNLLSWQDSPLRKEFSHLYLPRPQR